MSDNGNDNEEAIRIDAGRPRGGVFDREHGYSGQEHSLEDAKRLQEADPSGVVNPDADELRDPAETDSQSPPESGRKASFDPASGVVHGSGSGAGGGNIGEDYASDPIAGSDGGKHVTALGRPDR